MESLPDQTLPNNSDLPQSKKRKLAHIEKIGKLNPIFSKIVKGEKIWDDQNLLAEILNWKVVVPKEKFQLGDLVIYCEIDSILPDIKEFQYIKDKNPDDLHIKTNKFGNQISQGAVFPLSFLDNFSKPDNFKIYEGLEVTQIIGITKFEAPAKPVKVSKPKPPKAEPLPFPTFIEQTDEERIQNLPVIFTEKYLNMTYYVTEKVDGTSATFYYNDGKFGVCSRNIQLENQSNDYWNIAIQYKIQQKLEKYGKNMAIQGEIIGPTIQQNLYNSKNKLLLIYSVWDIDAQAYTDFETFLNVAKELDLETVPIIEKEFKLPNDVDELLKYAAGKSVLNYLRDPALVNPPREGVVIRSIKNNLERVSFKVISNTYLILKKE